MLKVCVTCVAFSSAGRTFQARAAVTEKARSLSLTGWQNQRCVTSGARSWRERRLRQWRVLICCPACVQSGRCELANIGFGYVSGLECLCNGINMIKLHISIVWCWSSRFRPFASDEVHNNGVSQRFPVRWSRFFDEFWLFDVGLIASRRFYRGGSRPEVVFLCSSRCV